MEVERILPVPVTLQVLHPVTVRLKPRSQSGFPMLADDETGRRIIDLLAELSAPFGTKIEFKDGVGFVKL